MKIMNGLDLQAQKITNMADPSANTDAANKQYVDNTARGLNWKSPVRAASTANITLASPGAVLDGVTLAVNDRVLLKNQTAGAENGVYVWTGAAAALTRATDAATNGQLAAGTAVTVTEGTVNADKVYMITSDGAITIGTTATTWGILGGGTNYTAGNGISVAGAVITALAQASAGVIVGASGIALDTSIAVRKFSANVGTGAATSIAIAHNLGTQDITWALRDTATSAFVLTDGVATDINTLTLSFAAAPAANAYRVTVHA